MKKTITFISDTHGKHNQLNKDLPGGDILIHAGDFMNGGYDFEEATDFLEWFNSIDNYIDKIFIAGNHDRIFENIPHWVEKTLPEYPTIDYLQDEEWVDYNDGPNGDISEENIRIYGSPWQPEFYSWAFNLPRYGDEMKAKWDAIPNNTDILVTHGPAFGYLDVPGFGHSTHVGCEMLRYRVDEFKPKIHVFGHIHGSAGYYFNGHTHFINASVLDERYTYQNKPLTMEWDNITNEIKFI
jgi:Icc-related predicted phosphoesterase